jgi:hypothetical protein
MNKNVFFIEDNFNDFEYFSKILKNHGYNIYPQDIKDQNSLSHFLHGHKGDYETLKNNIFNYIIHEELYDDKLSFLILDINLLEEDDENKLDESGRRLLVHFRNDFYTHFKTIKGENEKYKNWSKSIWTIALTNFDKEKCKRLENEYGTVLCALNKQEIKSDNQFLITKLRNMENQKNNDESYNKKPQGTGIHAQTHGNNSPIIIGDNNTVQCEIELENELKNHSIKQEDINDLLQVLKAEREQPNNDTLISKMKNWWNKVKSYVRDLSVETFGGLLSSLLQSAQIALIIQAIQ